MKSMPGAPKRPKPKDDKIQNLKYIPKPGDGPKTLPGKGKKPSKEEMKKILEDRNRYKVGGPRLLKGRESSLPKFLKKLMPKKSGAGYSGD